MRETTVLLSAWFPGITPEEGARRGPRRVESPAYRAGDRVTLRHNGKGATVDYFDGPGLYYQCRTVWLYYVTEDGGGRYPTDARNLTPGGPDR